MAPLYAILLLEAIIGLSSSIFIIISLAHKGFQRTNIAQVDRILVSLNVSNLLFVVFLSAYLLTSVLWPSLYSVGSLYYFLSYMMVYSITSSAWLTAVLCFFYFMKIVPSRLGVVMNIKNNIGTIVWKLILMVEIVCVGLSFLSVLTPLKNPMESNSTVNVTETLEETRRSQLKLTNILLIFNSLPFIVVIVTTVTSVWFLKVNDCQMKKNDGTLVNTNVRDYRSVVQTMMGLLIFYLFVFLTLVILALEFLVDRSVGFWVCEIILLSFPTGQSAFFIYSNPKLKYILKKLFTPHTCKVFGE